MTATFVRFDLRRGMARSELLVRLPGDAQSTLARLLRASREWEDASGGGQVRSDLVSGAVDAATLQDVTDYLFADDSLNAGRLHRHFEALLAHHAVPRYVARPGAIATAHELVGRDGVLAEIVRKLEAGTSVHLRAARRYGKSSVLEALAERFGREGRPFLLLDVASVGDPEEFIIRLIEQALAMGSLAPALEPLGLRPDGAPHEAVRRDGMALLRRVLASLGTARCILALDEISLMLRAVVDHHRASETWQDLLGVLKTAGATLPQVFAGSTGLSAFAHLHGLGGQLDHLGPVSLDPLDPVDARWLLEEMLLSDQRRPMPDAAQAGLEHLGAAVPYFVHAFADGLRNATLPGAKVTRVEVERLHARWVSGSAGTHVFAGYRLRNQAYPASCHETARAVLTVMARTPEGVTRPELQAAFDGRPPREEGLSLDALLPCLSEDFDLVESAGRWSFRSKLLRERWLQGDRWFTGTQEDR